MQSNVPLFKEKEEEAERNVIQPQKREMQGSDRDRDSSGYKPKNADKLLEAGSSQE